MPSSFLDFCRAADACARTTKKLEKQAILGAYFKSISDDTDLRRAVRYSAGRPFPTTGGRVLNVGGAIVRDVIVSRFKLDEREFWTGARKAGEIGEFLSILWPTFVAPGPSTLTLQEVDDAFERVAQTGAREAKASALSELFQRCVDPREAAYVSKIIAGDLRTGVQEGVLQAGLAHAFDTLLSVIQRGQLLVGDLDEVAILARRGECESAHFRLFHPLQFMLATPQEDADAIVDTIEGKTIFAEDKLDGIRAQIHKSGEGASARVEMYTRTMDRTDESFPEVVAAMRQLPGEFLLDGEVVPYKSGRVQPFATIQKRLGRRVVTEKVRREMPVRFVAFDLLYLNGRLLLDEPLTTRRAELEKLAGASDLLVTRPEQVSTKERIELAFSRSRDAGNEGLVLKDPASTYSSGRRGQAWLKLKTHLPTFDCVVTAAEYGHGKRRDSLSDYTFAVWDAEPDAGGKLVNIGKAYSGVTDEEIARLTELFLNISTQQLGRVHLVPPTVVLEIACDQIQQSARHEGGYALRFPRIKGVRWDKNPADADRLSTIAKLYESADNFGKKVTVDSPPEPTLFDHL